MVKFNNFKLKLNNLLQRDKFRLKMLREQFFRPEL